MRILIADEFESWGIERLQESACDVIFEPKLSGDALRDAIASTKCEVLIVRSTKVTEPMLVAADSLGLVVRAGAGVNTIDVPAASRRSVLVANCPGKNSIAVAELTMALILALDRRVVDNTVDLRSGRWNKKEYSKARGLKGRTLGIVGLGSIGLAVAERAKAFEMDIAAYSRSFTPQQAEKLGITYCRTPGELASRCDIFSIHLAATPQTKGLIDAAVLDQLAPGSYLINTSRADVLDHLALAKAVREKGLRVGLDVFPDEPATGTAEFRAAIMETGVVYGTHHIGASTDQAQDAIATETVRIVLEYMHTGRVLNCVNLAAKSRARHVLGVRHLNRPGVLAHTLNEISHAGVNVEEMENVICEGGDAACAHIKLTVPLPESALARIKSGNPHILGLSIHQVVD